jgi:hypothetical protein
MKIDKLSCRLRMTFTLLAVSVSLTNCIRTSKDSVLDLSQTNYLSSLSKLFEIDSLKADLQDIRLEKIACIKKNGINPESFDYCCGSKFEKISTAFLNQYKIIELEFERTFVKSTRIACAKEPDPCDELILFMEKSLSSKENIVPVITEHANKIRKESGINDNLLDESIQSFKKNYETFMRARALIASYLFDTVKDLKKVISRSGVAQGFDFNNFNPVDILDKIGIIDVNQFNSNSFELNRIGQLKDNNPTPAEIKLPTIMLKSQDNKTLGFTQNKTETQHSNYLPYTTVSIQKSPTLVRNLKSKKNLLASKSEIKAKGKPLDLEDKLKIVELEVDKIAYPLIDIRLKIENHQPNFNLGLLSEIDARDKIHALIGKSLVDESRIDKTKMPTEILRDIQIKKLILDTKN